MMGKENLCYVWKRSAHVASQLFLGYKEKHFKVLLTNQTAYQGVAAPLSQTHNSASEFFLKFCEKFCICIFAKQSEILVTQLLSLTPPEVKHKNLELLCVDFLLLENNWISTEEN